MARREIPPDINCRGRKAARQRCGYYLSPQHLVMARLEIEHIIPLAKGGTDNEENLWLACPICNGHKSDKTEATDPETGARVARSLQAQLVQRRSFGAWEGWARPSWRISSRKSYAIVSPTDRSFWSCKGSAIMQCPRSG